jgi:hypothetical protein
MRMRSELIALFLQFLEGSSTKNSSLPATLLARYSQNLFTLIFSVLYVISNNNVLKMTFEMYVFLVAPHFARGQSRSRKRTPMLWVHTPVYTHTHTPTHTRTSRDRFHLHLHRDSEICIQLSICLSADH